ncbi:MAG TPA: zinc ribbon domain-containing protein [Rubrobacteraceae bacterium]|nr:zinc ribbon domain-containing protein [Rubrobacteraceae bacterium]
MPTGLVEAARVAIERNRKPSRAGRRFWELTGGVARCKECGLVMNATHSTKTKKGRLYAYDYYRCSTRNRYGGEACTNSNRPRAEELEGQVWEFVFGLLTEPEQLREDMEKMVELERKDVRGDLERETRVWLEKLAEADSKRSGFQDMAAEGLITFDELREKLVGLEEGRKVAEGELKALEAKRSRLEQLEQDKETVLEAYAAMAPEGLEALTSEERQRLYKILRLEVLVPERGPVEASFGTSADIVGLDKRSAESEGTWRSARMVGR